MLITLEYLLVKEWERLHSVLIILKLILLLQQVLVIQTLGNLLT